MQAAQKCVFKFMSDSTAHAWNSKQYNLVIVNWTFLGLKPMLKIIVKLISHVKFTVKWCFPIQRWQLVKVEQIAEQ